MVRMVLFLQGMVMSVEPLLGAFANRLACLCSAWRSGIAPTTRRERGRAVTRDACPYRSDRGFAVTSGDRRRCSQQEERRQGLPVAAAPALVRTAVRGVQADGAVQRSEVRDAREGELRRDVHPGDPGDAEELNILKPSLGKSACKNVRTSRKAKNTCRAGQYFRQTAWTSAEQIDQ